MRPAPEGEGQQHYVAEVCNGVDAGTSIVLSAQAPENVPAQNALEAVQQLF